MRTPKRYPCASCPYRRDVPSGVWAPEEYLKLPEYDRPTSEQPVGVFYCHQDDERICSGWAGTHDGVNLLALRFAVGLGTMTPEEVDATIDYAPPVPLFDSGAEACQHGLKDLREPSAEARKTVAKIETRRTRRESR